MPSTKHTPEPWHVSWDEQVHADGAKDLSGRTQILKGVRLSLADRQANARRIVDCVNALAGIENPAEFMRKVGELQEAVRKADKLITDEFIRSRRSQGYETAREILRTALDNLGAE